MRIGETQRNPTGFRILARGWNNPWSGIVYLDKPVGLAEEGGSPTKIVITDIAPRK